jgi:hypothetical protein
MSWALLSLLACGGTKGSPASSGDAADGGWISESGWTGTCFDAPDLSTDKARQDTLNAMALQWRGGRNDGVSFPLDLVVEVRDLLRERPAEIPAIAEKNLEFCRKAMSGEASTVGWGSWLEELPAQLQEGECVALLEDDRYEYIELDEGWQHDQRLCAGETLTITASTKARFRLSEGGDWLTAEGDASLEVPAGALCTDEGCLRGVLLGRFQPESGEVVIFPIGARLTWTAPGAGSLSFALNDDDFGDNAWFVEDGYADKTALTLSPGG